MSHRPMTSTITPQATQHNQRNQRQSRHHHRPLDLCRKLVRLRKKHELLRSISEDTTPTRTTRNPSRKWRSGPSRHPIWSGMLRGT